MEITRTPVVPSTPQPAAAGPTPEPRAREQIAKAQVRQAADRRQLSDALAKAILADSGIAAADLQKFNVRLDIHKATGRVVAEIENKVTGELLQKIPSDATLRGAVMLEQVLGTILDTPA